MRACVCTYHTYTRESPMASGVSATAIALGMGFTCAIVAGGGVKCWGNNDYGKLGIGSTTQQTSPVTVPGAAEREGGACRFYIYIYIYLKVM